jgi:PAS domain S-box-containing protein
MPSRSTRPLELDPARAERLREESVYRTHVRVHPLTRLIVFSAVAVAVGLHNRFILDEFSWPRFLPVALTFLAYAVASWLALLRLYDNRPGLPAFLLYTDIIVLTYAIWASGGERSLLFFLPLVRVADQTHASFRRAMVIGHAALLGYAALIALLILQGRPIDLTAELLKILFLWAGVIYIAAVARTADKKRERMGEAMGIARRSVALNERILACAAESIVGVDLQERIVFANPRAARILGLSVEELIGRDAHEIAPHFAADGISLCESSSCGFAAAIRSGSEQAGEHPGFFRSDGTIIPVEFACSPMFEDGKPAGAVFSFRDITEKRAARQALITAKEAAEEANLAKSRFLANMSHELRTPLNAVIGYSEMIIDELSDSDRADLVADLEKIRTSGQNLLGMINDLLEVAKIEAGRIEVNPEEFDVGDLANELELSARKMFDARGIAFKVISEDQGRARADAVKIRRIVGTLLDNASKFTSAGEVTLRVSRRAAAGGEHLLFEVTDTGVGMDPQMAERLFLPFRQADMTATRRHGGTGLGLSIARGLANLMGGECRAVSVPNVGSTFTLEIPAFAGERHDQDSMTKEIA